MTQTCTQNPNDVIRYLYGEMNGEELNQMEELLAKDAGILSLYLDCLDIQLGLNQIVCHPSEGVVNRIKDFSVHYIAE
ncbi:MAG: hypothetical protein ACK4LB_12110 [Spirosomataceae bacterium]